jgi:hypothetical protein
MTIDPPTRVAAMLALLRPQADEIVVAVDSRVDPGELGAYVDVADRVVRFEFRDPVDRPRAWLHAQCRGDWILSLDGDEVPSPALVDQLDELVAADDVIQYHVPRRWLYPDPGTWLGELPWWPDFQVRLVRNDASLSVRGGLHGGIVPALPARHIEAPIYHLDCLVKTESERAVKAAAYEAVEPGPTAYGGGRLNDVLYLPERHRTMDLRSVPSTDRAWIEDVLKARSLPGGGHAGPEQQVAMVPAEEIDALAPHEALPEGAYHAVLSLFDDHDRRMLPDEKRPMYVRVENEGPVTWPWGWEQKPEIRVSYHWRSLTDDFVDVEGLRSPLTAPLLPGGTQIVPVWVAAPTAAGPYILELDLVHEHVRWFNQPLAVEMRVEQGRSFSEPGPFSAPPGAVH